MCSYGTVPVSCLPPSALHNILVLGEMPMAGHQADGFAPSGVEGPHSPDRGLLDPSGIPHRMHFAAAPQGFPACASGWRKFAWGTRKGGPRLSLASASRGLHALVNHVPRE